MTTNIDALAVLREAYVTYMAAPTVRNYDAMLDAIPSALDGGTERAAIQPAGEADHIIGAAYEYGSYDGRRISFNDIDFRSFVERYLAATISEATDTLGLAKLTIEQLHARLRQADERIAELEARPTQPEAKAEQADALGSPVILWLNTCVKSGIASVAQAGHTLLDYYQGASPDAPSSEASAGELPPLPEPSIAKGWRSSGDIEDDHYSAGQVEDYAQACIAADRAARTQAIVGSIGEDAEFNRLIEVWQDAAIQDDGSAMQAWKMLVQFIDARAKKMEAAPTGASK